MKFRYLLSGAAGAALLMGGAMIQPASAAQPTSGHSAWCMTVPSMSKTACRYKTLAACKKREAAENGSCVRNPKFAKSKMKMKKKSTTGMH